MGEIHVHEFMSLDGVIDALSLDGVIDAPTWTVGALCPNVCARRSACRLGKVKAVPGGVR